MFPKRLERTTIYQSEWINLYTDRVQLPSGRIIEKYHILDYPKEGVSVLATNEKGEICLIKSIRYSTGKLEWEIPGGMIEKGEDILEAGGREFFEETGFRVKALELAYSFNPSNGMSARVGHVAFAQLDESMAQEKFDTDETKEVHWLSKEEAEDLLGKNEIMDSFTLIPLLMHLRKLDQES